jgi:hypothetical protein
VKRKAIKSIIAMATVALVVGVALYFLGWEEFTNGPGRQWSHHRDRCRGCRRARAADRSPTESGTEVIGWGDVLSTHVARRLSQIVLS